jgi:hypothetical protein
MSLLSVVQGVAVKVGLPKPAAAASSIDTNVQQIVTYANEAGQELAHRYTWQALTKEASFSCPGLPGGIGLLDSLVGGSGYAGGANNIYNFVPLTGGTGSGATATIAVTNGAVTSVTLTTNTVGSGYAAGQVLSASNANLGGTGAGFSITIQTIIVAPQETQGTIAALTGPDFALVLNETMWDRTTRRPVYGPKGPAEWQQLKAQLMQGPWWQYRIRGGNLLFIPPPAVGDQIYFEWLSNYWVGVAATPTVGAQNAYVLDTDVSLLSERLIGLDTLWRYKAGKGLAYSEDFDKAEEAIADAMTRDASKPRLNLAGAQTDIYPGVLVPAGNWGTT